MRTWKIVGFLGLLLFLLLSACNSDDGEDVPPPQPRATLDASQPTAAAVTQIVTRTPLPTQLPTLTPTLAFDVRPLEGSWNLIVSFSTTYDNVLGTIHYSTTAAINILETGAVTGSGRYTAFVEYSECPVEVVNAEEGHPYRLQGELVPVGDGLNATLKVTFVPENPDVVEQFIISCDASSNAPREAQVLWSTLQANDLLTFEFDMSQVYFSQIIDAENIEGDLYFGR